MLFPPEEERKSCTVMEANKNDHEIPAIDKALEIG
jgi:hypothetical protein